MQRSRIVDGLRGFAIILVVITHVIEKSFGLGDSLINRVIASFFMPLFFFLSGLYALNASVELNLGVFFEFVRKKAMRLLLPFIFVGVPYSLASGCGWLGAINGRAGGLWFLPALFYAMLFLYAGVLFSSIIKCGRSLGANMLGVCASWALMCGVNLLFGKHIPFFLASCKLFPFLGFGLIWKWNSAARAFFENSMVVFASWGAYFACFYLGFVGVINVQISGAFAIVGIVDLARKYEMALPAWLCSLGVESISVYLFQWFFLPDMRYVRYLSISNFPSGVGLLNDGNVMIVLVAAVAVAVPIMVMCLGTSMFIKSNKFLAFIFLGEVAKCR